MMEIKCYKNNVRIRISEGQVLSKSYMLSLSRFKPHDHKGDGQMPNLLNTQPLICYP